ncbi:unnamed protein product, partial [Mesorhabditis spiculigera]
MCSVGETQPNSNLDEHEDGELVDEAVVETTFRCGAPQVDGAAAVQRELTLESTASSQNPVILVDRKSLVEYDYEDGELLDDAVVATTFNDKGRGEVKKEGSVQADVAENERQNLDGHEEGELVDDVFVATTFNDKEGGAVPLQAETGQQEHENLDEHEDGELVDDAVVATTFSDKEGGELPVQAEAAEKDHEDLDGHEDGELVDDVVVATTFDGKGDGELMDAAVVATTFNDKEGGEVPVQAEAAEKEHENSDGHEDGELMDDVLVATTFNGEEDGELMDDAVVATTLDAKEDGDEPDEDEAEEEEEHELALESMVSRQNPTIVVDPKLCQQCQTNEFKYKCPKCTFKSCSLDCSKLHKAEKECDGVRKAFPVVNRLGDYDDRTSIDDQNFHHHIRESLGSTPKGFLNREEAPNHHTPSIPFPQVLPDGRRITPSSGQEKYLLDNTCHRRIWLSFRDEDRGVENSRHEQFSDTIFWTVDLIFRKMLQNGEISEYKYRIHQVPETIRVVTVLRQFLKPRPFGPLVSKNDLDLEKLAPFINAGVDHVNVFMPVPVVGYENKYYPVESDAPVLENTRNRFIINHPVWVIVLDDEFVDLELPTPEDLERLQARSQMERTAYQPAHRGRGGGMRGRGRGRGGPSNYRGGGYGHQSSPTKYDPAQPFVPRPSGDVEREKRQSDGWQRNFPAKRCRNEQTYDRYDRGDRRGGRPNRGRDRFIRNREDRAPSFDPFNPFDGPCALPLDS